MGAKKKKPKSDTRKRITASQQKKIDVIVAEADDAAPKSPTPTQQFDRLKQDLDDSEHKRLQLAEALHKSRDTLRKIRGLPGEEEERALPFGVFVREGRRTPEGETAIIRHHSRLYEAKILEPEAYDTPGPKGATFHALRQKNLQQDALRKGFRPGELLLLNNDLHIIEGRGFELVCGSLATVEQVLSDQKLLVRTVGDETILVTRAEPMKNVSIVIGDNVEYDPDSLFVYSMLPKSQVDRLVLEKVPDISYSHIGGLADAIQQIRDAIELPHIYPEYFREHCLVPPKGILLYGPPGCGKTLVAKAVANSLAKSIREKTGEKGESYFLNVKGPELLNKYVGATEQAIRDLFARARNQATYRTPVVIFFDEMDAMFRVRGSGISSDMEATIVPQFLSELDGLQSLENVVVIGATNREDLIDPAILRPGRLDRKIRIPRPDRQAAAEIFSKYLTADLPIKDRHLDTLGDAQNAVQWMIDKAVEELYGFKTENELIEITFADGSRKTLYTKDLCSGAIIENIVNRAKYLAVKALIDHGRRGISLDHIITALRTEFEENEDLPSNSNPAEWYRIIGKGGERVIRIRSLHEQRAALDQPQKERKTVAVPDRLK
ncbi:MAG: proteasome ATPase [Desulfobacteraceae bacterium]|jgi:proteasome-associated ATPase